MMKKKVQSLVSKYSNMYTHTSKQTSMKKPPIIKLVSKIHDKPRGTEPGWRFIADLPNGIGFPRFRELMAVKAIDLSLLSPTLSQKTEEVT